MGYERVKFVFIKTPQFRHQFKTNNTNQIFPIIKHEIYQATLVDDIYKFYGSSFSGAVSEENFLVAIREGYISLVT